MSPYVDIGQVEGSYVMGLGMFTTEYLQFDDNTGEKMVTGTWVSDGGWYGREKGKRAGDEGWNSV